MVVGRAVGSGDGTELGAITLGSTTLGSATLGSATLGGAGMCGFAGFTDGSLLGRFHDTCLTTTGGAKRVAMGSVGADMVCGLEMLSNISANLWRAWRWLSVNGAKGELLGYCANALMRSWAAAVAAAAGDAEGMVK